MTPEEKEIRQKLKDDFKHYAAKCLKVRSKSGAIEPFILNKAQLYVHQKLEEQRGRTGKVRALVLKARQQGMSTYIGARYYHKVTHSFGCQAFILAHSLEATNNLYQMAKRFYEHTPQILKHDVAKSNAKELVFGRLDSGYKLGTAENKRVGRSSTIQLLHASEVGFWSNAAEHSTGVFQAVPNSIGTEIILESTANGVCNFFHQQWQLAEAGVSEFIPIFIPWYWQDEYQQPIVGILVPTPVEADLAEHYGLSLEQLNWRRTKIVQLSVNGQDGEKAFQQEYPSCATEAFILTGEDNFIPSDVILAARKTTEVEKIGSMVLGVDPARFGDDRTCIIRRIGRVAYKLESHIKLDTMQVAGLVKTIIEAERPAKVCVDVGGLGAGVVDRLRELGFGDIIVAVNFGASPYDATKYRNKKSEMWGLLKEWMFDGPVMIPDSDELHADLSGVKYAVDSNSRLVIESKESMKKRGVRSCDAADAICFVAGTLIHTPKGQVPIEQLCLGDEVITPFGNSKIVSAWQSSTESLTTAEFTNGSSLSGTPSHKVFTWDVGECRLDALQLTFEVETYSMWRKLKWQLLRPLLTKAKYSEFRHLVDTISRRKLATKTKMVWSDFYIVVFGLSITALYQLSTSFITKTMIGAIMTFQTWSLCIEQNITASICKNDLKIQPIDRKIKKIWQRLLSKRQNGTDLKKGWHGTSNTVHRHGTIDNPAMSNALFAVSSLQLTLMQSFVLSHAAKKGVTPNKKHFLRSAFGAIKTFLLTSTGMLPVVPSSVLTESVPTTSVYNLTLDKHNAYYANGILVFNCLTFAIPSSALTASIRAKDAEMLQRLSQGMDKRRQLLERSRYK